jgi:hypothetical protein
VADDLQATQEAVDSATADLAEAFGQLALRASKTVLGTAITLGAAIIANATSYAPASIARLPAALAAARSVYDDLNASQAQVGTEASALIGQIVLARLRL